MSYPTIANVKQKLIFNKSNAFSPEGDDAWVLEEISRHVISTIFFLDQSVRVQQLYRTDRSDRVILQGNSLKTWVFKKDIVKIN